MTALRGQFDKAIAPGLYAAYADEYDSLPAYYPDVFHVTTTERAFEEIVVTSGLGTTPLKPETVNVVMDKPMQVGTVKMTILAYGLGYEVSKELMDDDLYNVVGQPASRFLAQSGRDTEEKQAWALINGAFTTTQAYDGVSIVNTAHPLKGGGTYANRPAAAQALGFTSLQASLERYMLLVNERGLRVRMAPHKLVVPVQLSWLADEILGSSQKPHTANNEPNVLAAGKIGLTSFPSPYLTSTTAWVTLAPKHKLMFFWREKPNMDKDFDKTARVARFLNFMRFGTAAFDWRGIDGSTG
jgi:hypothetical protein